MNKNKIPRIFQNKNFLFTLIFVLIAVTSILLIIWQSQEFSFGEFFRYIGSASPLWICASVLSMMMFILFEGMALTVICRVFGYKTTLFNGYIYSAADIYFSAVTPSATGGQPASAYFMVKDGIKGVMVTAVLLLNLLMYTASVIFIGIICLIFRSDVFFSYGITSRILIVIGFVSQLILALFLFMLLINRKLLHRICRGCIHALCKIRILKNEEARQQKLDTHMDNYRKCINIIITHKKIMWLAFLLNLLQRISQITVTVFVYMATVGTSLAEALDVWFLQAYTVLGSNTVPVPGGIGIYDFIMMDGLRSIMSRGQAVHLELLSRSLSFYFCIFICGSSILLRYIYLIKKHRTANKTGDICQ